MKEFLFSLYKRQNGKIICYFILLLCLTVLNTSLPLIIKVLFDNFLFTSTNIPPFVILIVFLILILFAVLNFITPLLNNKIVNNSNIYIRRVIMHKIQRSHLLNIQKNKGKILQTIENDVPYCQSVLNSTIFGLFTIILSFFIVLIILFNLNLKLSLYLVIAFPIYIILYMVFGKKAAFINEQYLYQRDNLFNNINNIINNISILKGGMKINKDYTDEYEEDIKGIYKWYKKQGLNSSLVAFCSSLLQGIILMLVIILGIKMVALNELTVGSFIAFIMYSFNFFGPVNQIVVSFIGLKSAMVSIKRVYSILSFSEEIESKENVSKVKGESIKINNLSFSIEESKQTLKDVNAYFKKGKINIIVGENGAGKTTLLYSIFKLYPIDKNGIFIDNIDINDYSPTNLRSSIGFVFQNPQFIHDELKNIVNFQLMNNELSVDPIINNFILKYMHDFKDVKKIDELSGGKKQLLSFLYSISIFPKILILDEPFSNMDEKTKKECIEFLRNICDKIIVILISHNNEDILSKDNVIKIEKAS